MKNIVLSLAVILSSASALGHKQTGPDTDDVPTSSCLPIHGRLVAELVAEPCGPINLCTSGRIQGSVLSGETSFVGQDAAFAAGMPQTVAPELISYAGDMTVDTRRGKVNILGIGLFDTRQEARGHFVQLGYIQGGTGRFLGASGVLYFTGASAESPTQLVSTVRGEVCLVRWHPRRMH